MFNKDDLYNMDSMRSKIQDKRQLLELMMRQEAILQLLLQLKIITKSDFTATLDYVKTMPEYKTIIEYLDGSDKKAQQYQADPQSHLKDLFSAKLNGKI